MIPRSGQEGALFSLLLLCQRHNSETVLQMDHLRCKTPHRVRNEFFMHLVGYNLIRRVLALAAFESGTCPWQVSFKGALQTLNAFLPMLCSNVSLDAWCEALLTAIATHAVGNRPDRYEPRLLKRRLKKYKHSANHEQTTKPVPPESVRKVQVPFEASPVSVLRLRARGTTMTVSLCKTYCHVREIDSGQRSGRRHVVCTFHTATSVSLMADR